MKLGRNHGLLAGHFLEEHRLELDAVEASSIGQGG